MGFKRTEHKNALLKMVRGKRMILLRDAERSMNRENSLNSTATSLEKEGKIKRQKVKVRMQNGNLNDSWLLYITSVKQNEILEYEKELINRPFSSPLKENHCYKKKSEKQMDKIDNNRSNVIDMQKYLLIAENNLQIKEYKGQRVVTFKDIDNVHSRPDGTAKANFTRNKSHFIENVDYYELVGAELSQVRETYSVHKNTTKMILITETGYLMIVKTFTDELSWTIQRELINSYFKLKELKQDQSLQHVPQINNLQSLDIIELMVGELRKQNNRIDSMEQKLNKIAEALSWVFSAITVKAYRYGMIFIFSL